MQLSSIYFLFFSHSQQSPWQKGDKGLKISFKDVPRVHVPLVEHVNKGHFFVLTSYWVTALGILIGLVLLPGGKKAMSVLALAKKLLILEMHFLTRHCSESRT